MKNTELSSDIISPGRTQNAVAKLTKWTPNNNVI